jgi:HEPN domain-containing protein
MKDKAALVQCLIRKGDSDLADARRTLVSEGPYDTACFHAQQAAEKYLKVYLAWREQTIPRTHDVEELQRLSMAMEPMPELSALDLTELTAYAVDLRYDAEFWPPQPTAREALLLAEQVRKVILERLPLSARP